MASLSFSSTFSVLLPSTFLLPTAHKCRSSPQSLSCNPNSIMASSSSESTSSPSPQLDFSRRRALPLLFLPLFLSPARPALAIDIPLFGIRKRLEQAEKEVVQEVKELVKEGKQLVKGGEKEVGAAAGAFLTSPLDAGEGIPPAYQAAAVAGVELVAVLVASSLVKALVSEPRR